MEFEAIPIGQQYRALDRNEIDAANVFSTDGQLASGSYKVLEDTERVFGFQHVALVIDEDKLADLGGGDFMRVIDDLNGRLTTSAMIQMNRDVARRRPGRGDRRRAVPAHGRATREGLNAPGGM